MAIHCMISYDKYPWYKQLTMDRIFPISEHRLVLQSSPIYGSGAWCSQALQSMASTLLLPSIFSSSTNGPAA